jgi:predicted permease
VRWLDRIVQHLHYGLRGMRRQPGFTTAVVATLAIGIGLNTALFAFLYACFLRPLPVRDADRLVNVYQRFSGRAPRRVQGLTSMVSWAEFKAYTAGSRAFAGTAAYRDEDLAFAGDPDGIVRGELVSCGYFQTLQVRLALGRAFLPDECAHPGDGTVVVLGHGVWASHFGADTAAIGRTIRLNNVPVTVVGVAERGFSGVMAQSAEMWVPVTMQPTLAHGRDSVLTHPAASWLMMVGRLRPEASAQQAGAELALVARQLDSEHPGRTTSVLIVPGALLNFPEARSEGAMLAAFIGLLSALIIAMACANVMNLLLARGMLRRREVGIRLAVGATRGRLIEQMLIESGLLALLGAAFGMAFLIALPPALRAIAPVDGFQVNASPDASVVGYAFGVAIVTTLLFGLLPALQATSVDLVSAFKGGLTVRRTQLRPARLRDAAVGLQVALSALLLTVAGLFLRGVGHAAGIDPGFETRNVVAASLNLEPLGYDTARARIAHDELRARIASMPGVAGVAMAERLPLLGRHSEDVSLHSVTGGDGSVNVDVAEVSGAYFGTMGIDVERGRAWTDAEARAGGDRPAVVSRSMAQRLWPAGDAIGQRFGAAGVWYRVTGIAAEARHASLDRTELPFAYLAAVQPLGMSIVARTHGSPAPLLTALPAWARAIDPAIVVRTEKLEDRLQVVLLPARLIAGMTGALGAVALLLAVVGIYGVVSYAVTQRRREVALRVALGASARGVVALMMRQGIRAVAIGLGVGLALAAIASVVTRRLLFGLSPIDPVAYLVIPLILLAVSLGAMWLPARRAGAVDPATVLREE